MWVQTPSVVVRRSRFVGWATRVYSLPQARAALKQLKSGSGVAGASHNISACRVAVGGSIVEESADNGEPPAGERMLQLLRARNAENVLVVVSRWYGGRQLGPQRFRVICDCAQDALGRLELERKKVV